jgi:hypothetical protein
MTAFLLCCSRDDPFRTVAAPDAGAAAAGNADQEPGASEAAFGNIRAGRRGDWNSGRRAKHEWGVMVLRADDAEMANRRCMVRYKV